MPEINRAVSKTFSDWKKMGIGIIISIIPIVNWISAGYFLETSELKNKSKTLPEWNNFGRLFLNGFLLTIISLIYMLPAFILLLVAVGGIVALMLLLSSIGLITPEAIAPIAENFQNPEALSALSEGDIFALINALAVSGIIMLIVAILFILGAYLMPMAGLHFYKTSNFWNAFDITTIIRKAFSGPYFLAALLFLLTGIILSTILGWIPFIGGAIATFVAGVFGYTLLGEAYKETE